VLVLSVVQVVVLLQMLAQAQRVVLRQLMLLQVKQVALLVVLMRAAVVAVLQPSAVQVTVARQRAALVVLVTMSVTLSVVQHL
jgi:hypothetical protein